MKRNFQLALIGGSIVITLLLSSCSRFQTKLAEFSIIETNEINVIGNLNAENYHILAWDTSGSVISDPPKVGQTVQQNQILFELDKNSIPTEQQLLNQDFENISKLKEERDNNHALYLETANAAVKYYRKKAEAANTFFNNIQLPQATPDYLEKLRKEISEAESFAKFKLKKYEEIKNDSGPVVTKEARKEYILAQTRFENLQKAYNDLIGPPSAEELVIAKTKVNDAEDQLKRAISVRDNIKMGNYSLLFRYYAGYDYYDFYTNDYFFNTDKWNIVGNQLDEEYNYLKLQHDKMYTIAPFTGEVAAVHSQKGDFVSAGTPSVTIVDRNSLVVECNVPEQYIPYLKIGDKAQFSFKYFQGLLVGGQIKEINPIGIDLNSLNLNISSKPSNEVKEKQIVYKVKFSLDKTDFPIYLGASTDIVIDLSASISEIFVPQISVRRNADGEYLLLKNSFGDEYSLPISLGSTKEDMVMVFPINGKEIFITDKILLP